MDYVPLNYRQLNIADNMFMPNTVKSYNNKTFQFWARALFQRACSVFEFEVPEGLKKDVKLLRAVRDI